MLSVQYIRLFDFFKQQLSIDKRNVETFVEGVESIVEQKFEAEKNNFAPRTDIIDIKHQIQLLRAEIELLRQETKTAIAESSSNLKSEINKLIVWIIGIIFTAAAIFFALSKFINS